jgi:hypothetical protein
MKYLIAIVMILAAGQAQASDERWSDVDVSPNGNSVWSSIKAKEAEETLMYFCSTAPGGLCYFAAAFENGCDEDMNDIPILVSIQGSGAYAAELTCRGEVDGRYVYGLLADDPEDIRDAMMKGEWVRFAFPVESGGFRAVTFSLRGSEKAFRAVSKLAIDMAQQTSKPGYTQPVESGEF